MNKNRQHWVRALSPIRIVLRVLLIGSGCWKKLRQKNLRLGRQLGYWENVRNEMIERVEVY